MIVIIRILAFKAPLKGAEAFSESMAQFRKPAMTKEKDYKTQNEQMA